MSEPTQVFFEVVDFAENPEPRCPCLLLLDVSTSMNGRAIQELNDGLASFREELVSDSLAMQRVDVGIVTFGPAQVHTPFTTAGAFIAPTLHANGDTPIGEAIRLGLNMLEQRKAEYRNAGIVHYRPWVFMITDGAPTDEWMTAAAAIREAEASKKLAFFAVGVAGARMDILSQISVRQPLKLDGMKFRELFQWLSASMKSVSQSTPGAEVALIAPSGWAAV